MRVYVGKEFFEAWYYVPLLLMGTSFLGISNYYGAIYASAKANVLEIKSTLMCAISNIILNLLMIPRLKILGAVIATAASYVIVVIVRIIDTKKLISLKNPAVSLCVMSGFMVSEIFFIMRNNFIGAVLSVLGVVTINICILIKRGVFSTIWSLWKR